MFGLAILRRGRAEHQHYRRHLPSTVFPFGRTSGNSRPLGWYHVAQVNPSDAASHTDRHAQPSSRV